MDLDFWFPWYPLRYQSKTEHLSCLEDGAYRRLLDRYYINRQPLPDNDQALARIVGLPLADWREIAPTIRGFFQAVDGYLLHATANEELDRQDKLSRKRSKSAQKASMARWRKNNDNHALRMRDASGSDTNRNPIAMRFDATGQERTEQNNTPSSNELFSESSSLGVQGGTTEKPKAAPKPPARATQLPPGWTPNLAHVERVKQNGQHLAELVEGFTNHHRAKGTLFKDWDAGFWTWIGNDLKFNAGKRGASHTPPPPGQKTPAEIQADREAWQAKRAAERQKWEKVEADAKRAREEIEQREKARRAAQ